MANDSDLVLALTGNCYLQNKISAYKDEGFLNLVKLIRDADASFINLECCIQAGEDWPSYVAGNGRGATYMAAPPWIVDEFKWAGFNMICGANNHAADFGEAGAQTTVKYLKQAGLTYSGVGETLSDASAPGYLETAKGRVALISVSDWGPRGRMDLPYQMPLATMPGDPSPTALYKGRPGINLLRYDAVTQVDRETLDSLRRASKALGWDESKVSRSQGGGRAEGFVGEKILGGEQDTDAIFHFMGRQFALSDSFDFYTEPFQSDLDRNYKWIREARRQSDVVVVALHDQGGRRPHSEQHSVIFARGAIDNGADIFFNNGSATRGIEMYKGKLILHGVPGFYLQNEQVQKVPYDMMVRWGYGYEDTPADFLDGRETGEGQAGGATMFARTYSGRGSALFAVVYDEDRQLKEVRIHPMEVNSSGPRSQRNRPSLAALGSETTAAVLQRLSEQCEVFGTKVEIKDGVGIVRP